MGDTFLERYCSTATYGVIRTHERCRWRRGDGKSAMLPGGMNAGLEQEESGGEEPEHPRPARNVDHRQAARSMAELSLLSSHNGID